MTSAPFQAAIQAENVHLLRIIGNEGRIQDVALEFQALFTHGLADGPLVALVHAVSEEMAQDLYVRNLVDNLAFSQALLGYVRPRLPMVLVKVKNT